MDITYKETKEFEKGKLQDLFLSVNWQSGNYPDKLKTAMKNSYRVFSAWDGEKLIGLINCLSDEVMTSYFPYLLVNPEYHKKGIGKKLVKMMLEECRNHFRNSLIAYESAIEFYKSCGFTPGEGTRPLGIINEIE